jgi:hypothetical protein
MIHCKALKLHAATLRLPCVVSTDWIPLDRGGALELVVPFRAGIPLFCKPAKYCGGGERKEERRETDRKFIAGLDTRIEKLCER